MWHRTDKSKVAKNRPLGERMKATLKNLFLSAVSSSSTVVNSYDESPYPVEISADGSVAVDPNAVIKTDSAKRQIAAVRQLHGKILEKAK